MASRPGTSGNVVPFAPPVTSDVSEDTKAAVMRLRRAVAAMEDSVETVVTGTAELQDRLSALDERLHAAAEDLKSADRAYGRALETLAARRR